MFIDLDDKAIEIKTNKEVNDLIEWATAKLDNLYLAKWPYTPKEEPYTFNASSDSKSDDDAQIDANDAKESE